MLKVPARFSETELMRLNWCREHRVIEESGIPENVWQWMTDNGFFRAPASTQYHGAYEGGLFDHSVEVAKKLAKLTARNELKWLNRRSPWVVGMLHDICKTDQYEKLAKPDAKGRLFRYVPTEIPGHGDKSVIMIKS